MQTHSDNLESKAKHELVVSLLWKSIISIISKALSSLLSLNFTLRHEDQTFIAGRPPQRLPGATGFYSQLTPDGGV